MPNLADTLKSEIARLARKEAKAQTDSLRTASAQYRRDVAALKRQTDRLARQVAFLESQERKRAASGPVATVEVENKRFQAKGLASHRERLGLSAADYGKLVGVTGQSVYNWEQGRTRPGGEQMARLIEVRKLGKREAHRCLEVLGAK